MCESVGVTREAGVERQQHVRNNPISPPCRFCGAGYVIRWTEVREPRVKGETSFQYNVSMAE